MNFCIHELIATIILSIIIMTLAGCWDRVEIESRAFAMAMGVDSSDDEFTFSVIKAHTDNDENENGENTSANGQTLVEAMHRLNAQSSQELFLGQTKSAVFSTNLLEDEQKFRQTVGLLESLAEVDRMITILATNEDIPEVLNASPTEDAKSGYYVVRFYRLAPKSGGLSFHQTLESMMADLRLTGDTLIPLIDDEGTAAGAAVIKNLNMAGQLDGEELRGLLWAKSHACEEAVLGENIPMIVRRHRSSFRFNEKDGKLQCIIDVRIKGEISRFWGDAPASLEYEQLIAEEIKKSVQLIQQELEVDALNLKRALQKKQRSLYNKYANDWDENFGGMEIVPMVKCRIKVV